MHAAMAAIAVKKVMTLKRQDSPRVCDTTRRPLNHCRQATR